MQIQLMFLFILEYDVCNGLLDTFYNKVRKTTTDNEMMFSLYGEGDDEEVKPNLDCGNFNEYAFNCSVTFARIYNSGSRATLPLPPIIHDWCNAHYYLKKCADDWNKDCEESAETLFSAESIEGHAHILKHICNNDYFLKGYVEAYDCIEVISNKWEMCYHNFKIIVDSQKLAAKDWTHYETHFHLCCARARFKRCTLDILLHNRQCSQNEVILLQRFSAIFSEGDVYQNCNKTVIYSECPGGDPRPTDQYISKNMIGRDGGSSRVDNLTTTPCMRYHCVFVCIVFILCSILQ